MSVTVLALVRWPIASTFMVLTRLSQIVDIVALLSLVVDVVVPLSLILDVEAHIRSKKTTATSTRPCWPHGRLSKN